MSRPEKRPAERGVIDVVTRHPCLIRPPRLRRAEAVQHERGVVRRLDDERDPAGSPVKRQALGIGPRKQGNGLLEPAGGAADCDAPSPSRPTPETNAQPPRTIAAMPAAAARPASVAGESLRSGGSSTRSLVTAFRAPACASEGDACGRTGEDPFRPGRFTSTRVTTGIGDGDSTAGHDNERSSRHPRLERARTACRVVSRPMPTGARDITSARCRRIEGSTCRYPERSDDDCHLCRFGAPCTVRASVCSRRRCDGCSAVTRRSSPRCSTATTTACRSSRRR